MMGSGSGDRSVCVCVLVMCLLDTYCTNRQVFSSTVHCIDSRMMRKKKRSTIKCLATRC